MCRRILLLLIMAVLLLSPLYVQADDGGNLLFNPGFEILDDENMPSGWYTDAYLTREGVTIFSVSENAKSGQRSIMVDNCDLNDARFAQKVRVAPDTMYRLSGWIKADGISDAGRGANLSIEGGYFFSDSLYETDGEWTYIETYGITDEDQSELTIFARVGGYSGESRGAAYFDDLALVAVDELPPGVFAKAWYNIDPPRVVEDSKLNIADKADPAWPWLLITGCAYAGISVWVLRHFQLDRRSIAISEKNRKCMPLFTAVCLLMAFAVRIFVALNVEGYQVDVNCFVAWGNNMAAFGPDEFYQSNWCDYTPGYIYIMGLNGLIANLVQGIMSAAFIHKLIPMAFDILAACIVYQLAVQNGYCRRQAGLFSILMAFNPAFIINSAAWCQIDSVLCVGLMLVAYYSIQRKWHIVLPVYVLCILVKPQALMLGFLGLAALIIEWIKNTEIGTKTLVNKMNHHADARFHMIIGIAVSLVLALIIILPFCPNQESPWWLFELYGKTLSSYPYATVNTANLYYLAGANWDGINNPASPAVCAAFAGLSLAWCGYTALRQRDKQKLWWFEPVAMGVYTVIYLVLLGYGCSWTALGVVAMSMAFVLVLPIYIRSGKLEHLPLCGAVLFILLYVLGIKMHERYLFPALFLLAMAYSLHRDRRVFAVLIGCSVILFINEGIILDNSIRLGSEMGHLNADTAVLANVLSILNVAFALGSLLVCYRVCVETAECHLTATLRPVTAIPVKHFTDHPCTPTSFKDSAHMRISRLDTILMLAVTLVYATVTLTTLGSTKAPQKPWKSSAYDEYVFIDLGQHYDDFSMMYFCQVSYSNFAVAVSDRKNETAWDNTYPAEMREGMCFSWQYLDPSYVSADGTTKFVDASTFDSVQKLSGRYIRLDPKQVGLTINELIFKDAEGNIIPNVKVIGRTNEKLNSANYSDPEFLLDEQDTLDREPSWWNSTYFDEIYHARTAFEHLNRTTAYEWTHPPLGKILMSWFIGLFGMTPFGWRFAGALCGILMVPVMFLLVKQLTKRTDMAFFAMMLLTLDCMHFTQTRLATIDSYPVLFIMLSYLFMLRFMQRDIVSADMKTLLPDLALCGFFMGCGIASKWIGVYAGVGLAILYFWTCFRHLHLAKNAKQLLDQKDIQITDQKYLRIRSEQTFRRVISLCLWCLLFFVAVPVAVYLASYTVHYSYMHFNSIGEFLKMVLQCQESMLSYHGKQGLGMDHAFYSPWYEWPLMMKPMYYASAAFKPDGKTFAIFCFGNPWVWLVGIAGIAYTLFSWLRGHHYLLEGCDGTLHAYRRDWDIVPSFILIGFLAQFLPWVLVPRGTYIYHYFASVPFIILGTTLMFHRLTQRRKKLWGSIAIIYLCLCLIWFVVLFPYASGITVSNGWMDFISGYPYIGNINGYWENDLLVTINNMLEKIPLFPHVYHH